MHHTLHRFILGIRQEKPDFIWTPQEWHSRLAAVIPAPAVYGLFADAVFDGTVLQVRDDCGRVERFKPDVVRALGSIKIESIK